MRHAVRATHGHVHHCGGIGSGRLARADGGNHTIINGICRAAVDHVHHLAVHAQQQQGRVADLKPAHGGELVGRGGCSNGVAGSPHGDGGGRRRAGRQSGNRAARPVRVNPHGLHSGIVIINIILLHGGQRRERPVAIDLCRRGGKGQIQTAPGGDIGAAEIGGHHRRIIHMPVGNGIAQCGRVDFTLTVLCRQRVVEKVHAV